MLTAPAIRKWYLVHKWTSLVSTLFLLMLCITGLPLIFYHEIDHALGYSVDPPDLPGVTSTANLDRIIDAARARKPEHVVQYVSRDPDEPHAWFVSLGETANAPEPSAFYMFDARTGEYLHEYPLQQGIMYVLFRLHYDMFTGLPGTLFLGVMGLLLVASLVLWSFVAQAPLIATPITYTVNGKQYVTLLTGLGMGILQFAGAGGKAEKYHLDPRSQARRVLTFSLDGDAKLPPTRYEPTPPSADPNFKLDVASAAAGSAIYARDCARCHGPSAVAAIQAPDLRRSALVMSAEAFTAVVRDGVLVPNGMPAFGEFSDQQLAELRQYIRTEVHRLRKGTTADDRKSVDTAAR